MLFTLPGDTLAEGFVSLGFRLFDGVFQLENEQRKGLKQNEHGHPIMNGLWHIYS